MFSPYTHAHTISLSLSLNDHSKSIAPLNDQGRSIAPYKHAFHGAIATAIIYRLDIDIITIEKKKMAREEHSYPHQKTPNSWCRIDDRTEYSVEFRWHE